VLHPCYFSNIQAKEVVNENLRTSLDMYSLESAKAFTKSKFSSILLHLKFKNTFLRLLRCPNSRIASSITPITFSAIDWMQENFKCCGMNDASDWSANNTVTYAHYWTQ